jgi:hypothetical protein
LRGLAQVRPLPRASFCSITFPVAERPWLNTSGDQCGKTGWSPSRVGPKRPLRVLPVPAPVACGERQQGRARRRVRRGTRASAERERPLSWHGQRTAGGSESAMPVLALALQILAIAAAPQSPGAGASPSRVFGCSILTGRPGRTAGVGARTMRDAVCIRRSGAPSPESIPSSGNYGPWLRWFGPRLRRLPS